MMGDVNYLYQYSLTSYWIVALNEKFLGTGKAGAATTTKVSCFPCPHISHRAEMRADASFCLDLPNKTAIVLI